MQAIERNNKGNARPHHHALPHKEARFNKTGKTVRVTPSVDDCSTFDKLSKQMDDMVEGESPKRFKRLKSESDIIAR